MTTFAGFECLTIPPNAVTAWGSTVSRTVDRAENAQGNVVTTTRTDVGRDSRTLTWHCATRAELTALRAVLDARSGALVPLWIPTYQRDLHVTAINFAGDITTDLGSPASAIATLVDTSSPWQYWTAIAPTITTRWFGIKQTVTDLGSGVWRYEHGPGFVLDVGGPLTTTATSANGGIYSRLMLCRMATNGYHVSVLGAAAVVTAEFTQITAGS